MSTLPCPDCEETHAGPCGTEPEFHTCLLCATAWSSVDALARHYRQSPSCRVRLLLLHLERIRVHCAQPQLGVTAGAPDAEFTLIRQDWYGALMGLVAELPT